MKQTPEQRLLKLLKNKRVSVTEIANALDLSPKRVMAMVQELSSRGTIFDVVEDTLQLASTMPPVEKPIAIDFRKHKEQEFCIGAIADTHIGSKYERLDVLNALFDRFEAAGVTRVFLGGNMIDGEATFNKHDIYVGGVDGQVRNFVSKFPKRKNIITSFVTGDDHEGWYVLRDHVNVGQLIIDEATRQHRKDLEYLGHIERDVEFRQEGGSSVLRVIHAGGGSVYAISYTSQKYAESLQGGEKPSIVIVGHFHKLDYSYPREIHVIQAG